MCTHHSPQHYTNKKYLSMQRPLLILTAKLISDTECLLHGFSSPLKESPDAILTAVVQSLQLHVVLLMNRKKCQHKLAHQV